MEFPINSSEGPDRYRALVGFSRDDTWYLTLNRRKLATKCDLRVDDENDNHVGEANAVTEPLEQSFEGAASF